LVIGNKSVLLILPVVFHREEQRVVHQVVLDEEFGILGQRQRESLPFYFTELQELE